ncbi:hypothetical protein [Sporosarcina sp. FSL K6-1508]
MKSLQLNWLKKDPLMLGQAKWSEKILGQGVSRRNSCLIGNGLN